MLPNSRLSLPVFAIFILVIACYLAYLVLAKNIFDTVLVSRYFNRDAGESQTSAQTASPWANFFNRRDKNAAPSVETIPSNTHEPLDKKINVDEDKRSNEVPSTAINEPATATTQSTDKSESQVVRGTGVTSPGNPQYTREYELGVLWKKYSDLVPPLFSAPVNKNTDETLGRIAQISADLDQRYNEDKTDWIRHLEEVRQGLIDTAATGEREAARALSFQYMRPPLGKTVEALSWAMIANAISPNSYYLYICSSEFSVCTESMFEQASQQANYASQMFMPAAKSPVRK